MEENKKRFHWKQLIIVLVAVVFAGSLCIIFKLSNEIDALKASNSNLAIEMQTLRNEINSIYDNVDQQLKKQASLLSGIDFSIGNFSEDRKTVALSLKVVPKSISDDMQVSITVDGKTAPLERSGNAFSGTIDVGLFVDYNQWPLLSIQSAEGTKTEYLEEIDISYLFMRYSPSLYAGISSGSRVSGGTWRVDFDLSIVSKPEYGAPVSFTSFTLVEEVDGEEISRQDITDEVRKSGESENMHYTKEFKVPHGDELKVYVIGEDSLGYLHKTLAYYGWLASEGASSEEAIFGGEMIYDKEGNLLYGDNE